MSIPPEAWALIGAVVTAGPSYIAARRSRRKAADAGDAATGAVANFAAELAALGKAVTEMGKSLAGTREDVAEIRGRLTARPWFPAEVRSLNTTNREGLNSDRTENR